MKQPVEIKVIKTLYKGNQNLTQIMFTNRNKGGIISKQSLITLDEKELQSLKSQLNDNGKSNRLSYTPNPCKGEADKEVNQWISVEDRLPNGDTESNETEVEVIGYNENWVHPDFNPNGTRVCCMDDFGWRF